jgi:hypothetical protein
MLRKWTPWREPVALRDCAVPAPGKSLNQCVAGELGQPFCFTFGAGTNSAGGDPNSPPSVAGGLSPYFRLRHHILGDLGGRGFQFGTFAICKFVGFGGKGPGDPQDPGEVEFALSAQYRRRFYEVGLQGVIRRDFATTDADGEFRGSSSNFEPRPWRRASCRSWRRKYGGFEQCNNNPCSRARRNFRHCALLIAVPRDKTAGLGSLTPTPSDTTKGRLPHVHPI